jgi:hypothetical protein
VRKGLVPLEAGGTVPMRDFLEQPREEVIFLWGLSAPFHLLFLANLSHNLKACREGEISAIPFQAIS